MIVVVASEKRGTGKTTIATNLSVIRAQNGSDVLLIDADPRKSALDFATVREEESQQPEIICLALYGRGINAELRKLSTKFDDIIVDVGGGDITTFRSALLIADVLVVPFLSNQYDTWGAQKMDDVIGEAMKLNEKLRTITFLNKVDTYPKVGLTEEVINFPIEFKNLTFCSAYIGCRIAFRRSVADGLAVTELSKEDQKAITEIKQLYNEVFKDE